METKTTEEFILTVPKVQQTFEKQILDLVNLNPPTKISKHQTVPRRSMYGLLFNYMKGGKVRPDSRKNVGKDSLHGASGVNLRG